MKGNPFAAVRLSKPTAGLLDSTRLLLDLQRVNEIAQGFSGCLEAEVIAHCVTDGLINPFGCAFARIWLVEPDATALRLVASSGLYTRTDGTFARVPMGAYKVGKIAQNRVSFLSNSLAEETWIKDRDWVLANNIQGFAGYPLTVGDRVIGVIAVFSYHAMNPEFLEVLQFLCTATAIALETALHYQQEKQAWQASASARPFHQLTLCDQIAAVLGSVRLTLIGTEQPLAPSVNYVVLRSAEILSQMHCSYCRLLYDTDALTLEALISQPSLSHENTSTSQNWVQTHFDSLLLAVTSLGGLLQSQMGINQTVVQVLLKLPYDPPIASLSPLSEREQEIMTLLAQGLRDRDVAQRLIISESTVKFHLNNVLKKLKAQTRYQALYQAITQKWIE